MMEDFVGSCGRAVAVPVRVIQKIEIFFLVKKGGCVLGVATFESDGGDLCVLKRSRKVLQSCARS